MGHLTSLRIHNRLDQHRVFGLIMISGDMAEARALELDELMIEIGPFRMPTSLESLRDPLSDGSRFFFGVISQQLRDGPTSLWVKRRTGATVGAAVARYDLLVDNHDALAHRVGNVLDESGSSAIVTGAVDSRWFPYGLAHRAGLEVDTWKLPGADEAAGPWAEVRAAMARDGYAIFPERIPDALCDQFVAEVGTEIEAGRMTFVPGSSTRLHQTHRLPSGGRIWRFPPVVDFLSHWFGSPPAACQTLFYFNGSQQRAHQDTIHLTAFPAGHMCGVWVALEDVVPDSGELFVYPGSHRLPRLLAADLNLPKVREDYSPYARFDDEVERLLVLGGFERKVYRPRKGEILVWHENLVHGGSRRENLTQTRISVVSHYFARGAIGYYDSRGEAATLEELA